MKSGQLRQRLTLERRGTTRDSSGGVVDTWETVAAGIHAKVFHKTGSEQVLSERIKGVTVMDIHMRLSTNNSAMKTDDRLTNDRTGELYNIVSVLPDMKGRVLMITATLGTLQ